MFRHLTRLLPLLSFAVGLPGMAAAATGSTMRFHWEGGLFAHGHQTVLIASDGAASCEVHYGGRTSKSVLTLAPQETAYLEAQFRRVVALDRKAIEEMATDAGITTWRLTDSNGTRELSYIFTRDPWVTALSQAVWPFVNRETALLRLRQDSSEELYETSYHILTDLQERSIYRPEDMAGPLLAAARGWPAPGLSFYHSRDTISYLLQALAYCEPPQKWVGDVMALFAGKPREARVIMLRAISDHNFMSGLKDRQGQLLVPLMIEGLQELLATPRLQEDEKAHHACMELINALGEFRDERTIKVLSSDRLWSLRSTLGLASWAGRALCKIGMPGVQALVPKASSQDEEVRRTALWELQHAAEFYAFPTSATQPERAPWPSEVDEIRRFLVERGLSPEGVDSFNLPGQAAAELRRSSAGWRLMESAEFSDAVVDEVRSPYPHRAGPQRCRGDFDGNGLEDIALLIRKDDAVKLVALRQMKGDRWTTDEIAHFTYTAGTREGREKFATYITTAPGQTVAFWSAGEVVGSEGLTLKNAGIAVHHGKEAGMVYYWSEGKKSAPAGD